MIRTPTLQRPERAPVAPLRAPGRLLPVGPVAVAIGALAFAIRLAVMLRGGGLTGMGGYDDGVYYAAGDALVHGRIPYADFLLLHPPGVALAVAPFAAFGSLTADPAGLTAARLAFELIGGLNTALIVVILRRWGWAAALTGGVLYAVLPPAVWAERSVLLEPLGTLGVLLAVLLLQRARTGRGVLLAGLAAGWSADVKIWYVVPIAVLALCTPGMRDRLRFALGAALAVAIVWGPSLLAAPQAMVREVVLDQIGRPRQPGLVHRLAGILGAHAAAGLHLRTVTLALTAAVALAVVLTLLTRGARVFAVLLLADAAVLLLSPSWFRHYGGLTAPPLALCAGIGVQRVAQLLPARRVVLPVLAAGVAAALLLAGLHLDDRIRSGFAVPAAFSAAVDRTPGCITSDDPTVLESTGLLSRDLADARCPVWPDVTGWTYDRADVRLPDGRPVPRPRNAIWQRLVLHHLRSGDATIPIRPSTGLSARSRAVLDAGSPLVHVGRFVLRPTDRR
ncbi:hypothetical protein GCM10025783_16710 [Amnibacterium soli]|uniref:Glycosyltransferase RgtA/B/C/D-like domain-containing protein n=1 Tax=Amnibacterium soli TaxID=1282736 RepID=A0ABP8Z3F4_9MICO